jgi:hypothetical protein
MKHRLFSIIILTLLMSSCVVQKYQTSTPPRKVTHKTYQWYDPKIAHYFFEDTEGNEWEFFDKWNKYSVGDILP